MDIKFIGPTYDLPSRPSGLQRTVNMVPVPEEPGNERTAWVYKDVPGLVAFNTSAITAWAGAASVIYARSAPPLTDTLVFNALAGVTIECYIYTNSWISGSPGFAPDSHRTLSFYGGVAGTFTINAPGPFTTSQVFITTPGQYGLGTTQEMLVTLRYLTLEISVTGQVYLWIDGIYKSFANTGVVFSSTSHRLGPEAGDGIYRTNPTITYLRISNILRYTPGVDHAIPI